MKFIVDTESFIKIITGLAKIRNLGDQMHKYDKVLSYIDYFSNTGEDVGT